MDLDNLKAKWNEIDVTPTISEDKIQQMVNNKGKSALGKLLRLEKIGLVVLFLCIGIPFLHNHLSHERLGYTPFLLYGYILLCVGGIFWQYYKIKLLRGINLDKLDIVTCLKSILRYKKYINNELFVGIIILILFLGCYTWSVIDLIPDAQKVVFAVYVAVITLIFIGIIFIFYRKMYKKRIVQIEDSLQEVKDFEEKTGQE
ncbi:cbb3-type cytochrome oxidase subunit 3 [Dysgonomonas sp. PH5-45]|uniref:hypothetical protein n=1 Tax=unclassified Dysgonomonas TaxID=2630389 RepID=UPI0024735DBD|nr:MULTISPECIES: hypothetical protein [unclassified Dysgonomonas]MDH6355163.1 cbb3-type cytochrome oxidase subunit 3 [Dysgonomonas sp. PH5-45]MDH6388111.1 cbb3-type cytochrome oxidase subunit 3 [Dysgonomonas sp. PH5-37]